VIVIRSLVIVDGWLDVLANNGFHVPKTAELTSWQTHGAPGNETRLIVSTVAEAEHLAATSDKWNTSDHKKMNVTNGFNFLTNYRLPSNVNSDTVWRTIATINSQQTWPTSTPMWDWQSQRSDRPSSSTRRLGNDHGDGRIQDRHFR